TVATPLSLATSCPAGSRRLLVRLRLGRAHRRIFEPCGKRRNLKTNAQAGIDIVAQPQGRAHGVMYVIYAPMPRATAKASFGTDYRRARSQQRWCDRVGIRTGFGAPMRCDDSTIHVIEAHHHALHVSQPKSRQSKIEEKVTKSSADLEEIVEIGRAHV